MTERFVLDLLSFPRSWLTILPIWIVFQATTVLCRIDNFFRGT